MTMSGYHTRGQIFICPLVWYTLPPSPQKIQIRAKVRSHIGPLNYLGVSYKSGRPRSLCSKNIRKHGGFSVDCAKFFFLAIESLSRGSLANLRLFTNTILYTEVFSISEGQRGRKIEVLINPTLKADHGY